MPSETVANERAKSQSDCPYRQATLLQQVLAPDKMRIAFFLGAGCPMAIRVPDGQGGLKPLIPDIRGLTDQVCRSLELCEKQKTSLAIILQRLIDAGNPQPTIEDILSLVRTLHQIAGGGDIGGLSREDFSELEIQICTITNSIVNVELPNSQSPYHDLASWIAGIRRVHPVEVFTSNYDLLMEQAFEECRVPYFDGFVGSHRTFFDLTSMEQDNLPARWARLWKVHGSINWRRTADGEVERRSDPASTGSDCPLIYPSHLKYDQSRRMPYLAMLDRLSSFLRRGQAVLVTCGYSFSDQHLNEIILQELSGNPTAICFALLFGDRENYSEALSCAKKRPNLSLLAVDGAILGRSDREWHSQENVEHPLHTMAVQTGEMNHRSSSPTERCKLLLGDFMAFGRFLSSQLPAWQNNEGGNDVE